MKEKDKENLILLALAVWLLWPKKQEIVTAGIDFPQSPEPGYCYDPETNSYYVGDCAPTES